MSFTILLVAAGIHIYYQYTIYLEYLERTYYLENRIREETERNEELLNLYVTRFSDERVEQIARERLGLIRSNEILFIPKSEN